MSIVSGLGWALVAMYMLSLYASGDPSYGLFAWGFGMMAVVLSMASFFLSWWVHRKATLKLDPKTGENFYTDDDPDYKEMHEILKARATRRKLRGR